MLVEKPWLLADAIQDGAMTCQWCGDRHGVDQLCQRAQRGMTRRSFCFLFGAGVAGLALAQTVGDGPWIAEDIARLRGGGGYGQFPHAPFNVAVVPIGQLPTAANAEIVRVERYKDGVFTVRRGQQFV